MDFKNKYLLTTLRILMGLFLLSAAIFGYVGAKQMVTTGEPLEGVSEKDMELTKAYWDTGIIQLAKLMELIIAVMLIFNILPALAAVFLAPLSIGILVYHAFASPHALPFGVVMVLINAYFGYAYWDKYRPMFQCAPKKKKK